MINQLKNNFCNSYHVLQQILMEFMLFPKQVQIVDLEIKDFIFYMGYKCLQILIYNLQFIINLLYYFHQSLKRQLQ